MAKLYPELPLYADIEKMDPKILYQDMLEYAGELKFLLEQRDREQDLGFTSRIFNVVTATDFQRPQDGNITYSTSSGKFRGFVSVTGWVDFN